MKGPVNPLELGHMWCYRSARRVSAGRTLQRAARGFYSASKPALVVFQSAFKTSPVILPNGGPTQYSKRYLSTLKLSEEELEVINEERACDHVDVCIVGAGPAGLATAIKLKQLDLEHGDGELRVVVLEKAGDFGSHTVSGAVIEPQALRELFPLVDTEDLAQDIPLPVDLVTRVTEDRMAYLTDEYAFPLPEPEQLKNKGKNFIVSLNTVVQYLAEQAEELGVELYPGTAVDLAQYREDGSMSGVVTKDVGLDRLGRPKASFERGMEFKARFTVLAEGCHGLVTKKVISKFDLRKEAPIQTYGLGIKEVWEVPMENFEKGLVAHSLGFPLPLDTYGGGFMYHFGDGLVAVGLVVGLDYPNPYLSPYQEFQKMKTHPYYRNYLEGGKCVSYAARALNEGGLQSVPRLYFPGGMLVGASAGFMNVPKIKGTHTAIKSGILAAESMFEHIQKHELEPFSEEIVEAGEEEAISLESYERAYKDSWIHLELHEVRNVRPSFHNGFLFGLGYSGFATMLSKGREPWTFEHKVTDAALTVEASRYEPIEYPKPDGKLTFDILTSVSRTGTYHDEDEPCHLKVPQQDMQKHAQISWPKYQGVELRFCPAGVYEYVEDETESLGVRFQINSQNCVHCKTCDIKVPTQDIDWHVPEGGDGPKYYMT